MDRFNEDKTEDMFYLADSSTIKCDFMNMIFGSHGYVGVDGILHLTLPLRMEKMVFVCLMKVYTIDIISDPKLLSTVALHLQRKGSSEK